MRSKTYFSIIILLLALISSTSCSKPGSWLVKEDEISHADAIVILMGSIADRVLETADLYREGKAGKVIVVEENMGPYRELKARGADFISNTTQAYNAARALGIPADSITILPGDASSTSDEAMIIREYLEDKPDIDTILLVSSAPHTRRASMIFKAALHNNRKTVVVLCSPSRYTDFDPENWWKNKEGVQTVMSEYLKMLNFCIFERRELRRKEKAVSCQLSVFTEYSPLTAEY